MKPKLIIATALAASVAAAGIGVWKWSQLKGQAPSWWRLVRTETGGQPYYDPIQYRAPDSRPAITNPVFLAASEVKMTGGTMGIGVAVGNEAKFYPLTVLSYHQVVNDTCGGKKIACTYWPGEQTLKVLERTIQGTTQEVSLRVSGQVRLGNLIAYDTNTGSLWLQETGEALQGPLKGKKLSFLNEKQWQKRVRWDEWKKQYPGSLVMHCDHCAGEAK